MPKKYLMMIAVILLLSGCASATEWPHMSGFLGSYKGMYRSEDIQGLFILPNPKKKVNDYTKFIVEPVQVYITPNTAGHDISQDELQPLVTLFHQKITDALNVNFEVVENRGPNTLRIVIAITEVIRSGSGKVKAMTIEGAFVDSITDERIAIILQHKKGNPERVFSEWAEIIGYRLEHDIDQTKSRKIINKVLDEI